MSHEVDLTKKLSQEDREYLTGRGEYIAVERNDAQFAAEGSEVSSDTPESEKASEGGSEAASTQDAPSLPDTPPDYESMKVEELKAELDKRKAAYEAAGDEDGATDVSYSSTDKKADLITLLEEDDAATADEDEETS